MHIVQLLQDLDIGDGSMKKQTPSTPVIVLVSGGMDSVVALYHAAAKWRVVEAVSFHYGSKHNDKEMPCARYQSRKLGIPHRVIRLGFVNALFKSDLLKSGGPIPDGHYHEENMKQTVVPFRNGIMLAVAAGYAESVGAKGVVIAAHSGDHAIYPDCREGFMKAMGIAMRLGSYENVALLRPFIALTKTQIARRGHKLGVDFARTWSCYKGRQIHCGTCGTCVERREAFKMAGLQDPTAYESTGPLPNKPCKRIKPK
jgi:7-cyano-7-deazaguanine synthase